MVNTTKKSNSTNSTNSNSKDNDNDDGPLLLTLDGSTSAIEDFFTKAPQRTRWTTAILNSLKGASFHGSYYDDYLDKIDPVSERQLKAIFPNASATQMDDPLTTVTKTRLHDNVRRDPSTQRALFFLLNFLLGKDLTLAFEVNRKFATEERRETEIKAIQANEQYLDILEELMNRDEEVDLQSRLAELVFSAEAFGRAVQIKKYNRKGFPIELIPLSSTRLGRVWVDRKTWEFLGVEYLDYPREQRILLAKDIIHYEVNDFHISPNSRYFGIPSIESTMAIAERNRSANELAIPEIMKRMFAPIMIVKTATKSTAKLQEIRNKWKAGKTLFINDEVEIESIAIQHDLDKIVTAVMEGSKDIYRGLTVPLVVAFQDEQNRATAEHSIIQWYESTLQYKRNQLNNMIWQQWYKPQLEKIFESKDIERAASTGSVLQYLETRAQTISEAESNGEEFKQQIPFKVKLEFSNVRTTGFLDTASALIQFGDRKLLLPHMIREEAGLERWNNDMQEFDIVKTETIMTEMEMQRDDPFMMQNQQMKLPQQPGQAQGQKDENKKKPFTKKLPTRSSSNREK